MREANVLTFGSLLDFVVSRWTLQILLNMAPNESVNPMDKNQALAWHTKGYTSSDTNCPSNPRRNTLDRQMTIPMSMIVLHLGWEVCITLESNVTYICIFSFRYAEKEERQQLLANVSMPSRKGCR